MAAPTPTVNATCRDCKRGFFSASGTSTQCIECRAAPSPATPAATPSLPITANATCERCSLQFFSASGKTVCPDCRVLPTNGAESLPFPKMGITLRGLDVFVQMCGGRANLTGMTTTEVCEKYGKPMTSERQESLCEHLQFVGNGAEVRTANAFVSHAWRLQFMDVVDTITRHFLEEKYSVVVWFDLFSNNQHKAPNLTFDWWATTFKSAIKQFGRTCLILTPWKNPVVLTRAWCLWEIFCTVETGSKFEVAMTAVEEHEFHKTLLHNFEQAESMISVWDLKNADAWSKTDKQQIFDAVERSGGFARVNAAVFKQLEDWLAESGKREVDRCESSMTDSQLCHLLDKVGVMFMEKGLTNEAEALLIRSLEARVESLGPQHKDTLQSMMGVAEVFARKGLENEAEMLMQQVTTVRTKTMGADHADTLMSSRRLHLLQSKQPSPLRKPPVHLMPSVSEGRGEVENVGPKPNGALEFQTFDLQQKQQQQFANRPRQPSMSNAAMQAQMGNLNLGGGGFGVGASGGGMPQIPDRQQPPHGYGSPMTPGSNNQSPANGDGQPIGNVAGRWPPSPDASNTPVGLPLQFNQPPAPGLNVGACPSPSAVPIAQPYGQPVAPGGYPPAPVAQPVYPNNAHWGFQQQQQQQQLPRPAPEEADRARLLISKWTGQ